MCGGGKAPQPQPPAAAPAPPADPPQAPVINERASSEKNTLGSSRNGRNSLRIDLATSSPSGGAGLNIPT